MASMMALPHHGHLQQVFHMFAFLKAKHNGSMVFDPTVPFIDEQRLLHMVTVMKNYLPICQSRGELNLQCVHLLTHHTGDVSTRWSHTGFIIFLNSAPIYWFSKKQTSVETSSFGSEFIAMKQCCEYIRGLRYKLRMMGIPVELPTFILGNNQSVLCNT